jgi:uroporphyrinogen decarboxylase
MTDLNTDTKQTSGATLENSRFLKACHGQPVDAVPIWLMRQAGRYMEEYRELKRKYEFLDLVKTPELARDVTMQPINAFDLDAAIIFADILPILEPLGLQLEYIKGEGPTIHNPIRNPKDIDTIKPVNPEESLWFTLDAIKLTRESLDPLNTPLIGFSGAPFTLASYAIEGGSSKNRVLTKSFMYEHPDAWHKLMNVLAESAGAYLKAQAESGAHVLQLFDSWVGIMPPNDYREFVQPHSKRALDIASEAGVPVIHFGTESAGILADMRDAGGDILGADWRIDIDKAAEILGDDVGIQGNLDPVALHAPWPELKRRTQDVLDRMEGRDGFIFNLGHGILKTTPVDNVKRLAEFVHDYTAK